MSYETQFCPHLPQNRGSIRTKLEKTAKSSQLTKYNGKATFIGNILDFSEWREVFDVGEARLMGFRQFQRI